MADKANTRVIEGKFRCPKCNKNVLKLLRVPKETYMWACEECIATRDETN